MRPVFQLYRHRGTVIALAVLALSMGTARAQSGVAIGFGNDQLTSLKYNGTEYLNDGSFVVNRVMFVDSLGNHAEGSVSATASMPTANTLRLAYNWGSVQVTYAPVANRLNLTIAIKNTSAQTIEGLFLNALNLKFPSSVLEYDGNTPLVDSNLGSPTLIGMTAGANTLVFANDDTSRPLMAGFPWALDRPANSIFPLRINTNRDSMYPTFWPFIDRPIAAGATDQYHLSLRFGPAGSSLQTLGGDIYQGFNASFPSQLNWTDRRPVGMLVLGTSAAGWATNPRGWLMDSTIDVTTTAGLAQFKTRILQWADNSVQLLRNANAQGMITWDIEGEQFPQSTSYVCDPAVFAATAPEMAGIADAYFQKFRDAGLRVGVCVRPQQFVLSPDGKSAKQLDVADPTQLLIDKINYAKSRWGASIFYVDSNGGPGSPMDPSIFQRVSAAVPGVLIVPEHSNLQYYAYTAPYRQVNQGKTSAQSDARLVYPKGFSILNVADAPIQPVYNQLVTSVSQGDVLMFRAWFDDGSLSSVKSIYQAAGQPPPSVDKTPPTVSILSPLPGATISGTVTVSANASDNVGVAKVQFLLDASSLGVSTAAPYTASVNSTAFADGNHSLSAIATDLAGNVATATINIAISNRDTVAPVVAITAPGSLSTVSGTITLTASATDNVGVASVQFKVDGTNNGAGITSPPYSRSLDTSTLANGSHTVSAVASDAAGNTGTSAPVRFTVNNSLPVAACGAPAVNAFTGCYYSGQNFESFVFSRTDPIIHFDWSGTGPQGAVALGPDNYSVRWQGTFQFQTGTYQFTLTTDDGARLYIDGQSIYNNWTVHPPMQITVNAALTAGSHLIQLEYFQAGGGAVAQLSWSGSSAPPLSCGTPGTNVFTGCYYSGQNFDTLVFGRTDPAIHFDWTGTGPQGPSPLGPDNYSVRWQGNFQFQGGNYQFTLNTDDGDRLYVDGVLVYSNWIQHGSMPVNVAIQLTAGTHLIQFEYFQVQGGAVAQLSWTPAS